METFCSHGEKSRTRIRIKRVDLKIICMQNGESVIIDLYRSTQKNRHIC